MLIEYGSQGMPATEIADRAGVRKNLMSAHLQVLSNAGLTTSRRDGRRIFHAIDLDAVRALLGFLVSDCCKAHPERCASLLDDVLPRSLFNENGPRVQEPLNSSNC